MFGGKDNNKIMRKSKRWGSAHASLPITRKHKIIVSISYPIISFLCFPPPRLEMQICPLEALMRRAEEEGNCWCGEREYNGPSIGEK